MQYTSGSFAGIVGGWFAWVLRPERTIRRARGPLPSGALWLERVPDAVLDRILLPAGGLALQAAGAVRALQHGRLQAYIVYLVTGLAAVAALVVASVAS
jgi:hydrogenase-4 component B